MTKEKIHKLFDYCDGNLIWKDSPAYRVKAGDEVGCRHHLGYRQMCYKGERNLVHRVIWIYFNGEIPPELEVDHINGVRDDNRIENLRLVTHRQNLYNSINAKGYCWDKRAKKYRAQISVDSEIIYLGIYGTKEEARCAYLDAKRKYHKIEVTK